MKRNYKIEIKETLEHVYDIEANSLQEAISIANEKYRNEEFILDTNDYKSTEIKEYNEHLTKQNNRKSIER